MKAFYIMLIFVLSGTSNVTGQRKSPVSAGIDLGSAFKSTGWSPSMQYQQELRFRQFPFLKFGLGLRGWGYYDGKTDLFSKMSKSLTDTLKFRNVSQSGLSVIGGLSLSLWKIDFGINTDLFGLLFGSERRGFYSKSAMVEPGQGESYYNKWVPASPNVFNLLPLVVKDNSGQSEIYARIWLSRRLGLKVAYVYGQLAYSTGKIDGKPVLLDNGHRRFSENYGIPYAGLSFYIDE